MPDKDELITAVRTALDAIFRRRGDLNWTAEVKQALITACRECVQDAELYAGSVENAADGLEWLYDVTCLVYHDDAYLKRIPLVAESEWGNPQAIFYDFEKLLLARADVRVMVFDGGYWGEEENKFETLARYITRCDRTEPGDTYLLAAYTDAGFEYCRIDAFQCQCILE